MLAKIYAHSSLLQHTRGQQQAELGCGKLPKAPLRCLKRPTRTWVQTARERNASRQIRHALASKAAGCPTQQKDTRWPRRGP